MFGSSKLRRGALVTRSRGEPSADAATRGRTLLILWATFGLLALYDPASALATPHSACRVPRLTGLTLKAASARARRAGCRLRVEGAAHSGTVVRQTPRARRSSAQVIVWLRAAVRPHGALPVPAPTPPPGGGESSPRSCTGGLVPRGTHDYETEGPYATEHLTEGPSELVVGFFLDGGPAVPPPCERPPTPDAGTVEVLDSGGGVVATRSSQYEQLAAIALAPGSYTVNETFDAATICSTGSAGTSCDHPTQTRTVTIPAGYTVRVDFELDIP